MRRLDPVLRLGTVAIVCAVLSGAIADAAVTTRRLGTGLPADGRSAGSGQLTTDQ